MDISITLKGKAPDEGKTHKFSVEAVITSLDPTDNQGQLDLWKNAQIPKNKTVLNVHFPGQISRREEGKMDAKEDLLVSILPPSKEEMKTMATETHSEFQTSVGSIPSVAPTQTEGRTGEEKGGRVKAREETKGGLNMVQVILLLVIGIAVVRGVMWCVGY